MFASFAAFARGTPVTASDAMRVTGFEQGCTKRFDSLHVLVSRAKDAPSVRNLEVAKRRFDEEYESVLSGLKSVIMKVQDREKEASGLKPKDHEMRIPKEKNDLRKAFDQVKEWISELAKDLRELNALLDEQADDQRSRDFSS